MIVVDASEGFAGEFPTSVLQLLNTYPVFAVAEMLYVPAAIEWLEPSLYGPIDVTNPPAPFIA